MMLMAFLAAFTDTNVKQCIMAHMSGCLLTGHAPLILRFCIELATLVLTTLFAHDNANYNFVFMC